MKSCGNGVPLLVICTSKRLKQPQKVLHMSCRMKSWNLSIIWGSTWKWCLYGALLDFFKLFTNMGDFTWPWCLLAVGWLYAIIDHASTSPLQLLLQKPGRYFKSSSESTATWYANVHFFYSPMVPRLCQRSSSHQWYFCHWVSLWCLPFAMYCWQDTRRMEGSTAPVEVWPLGRAHRSHCNSNIGFLGYSFFSVDTTQSVFIPREDWPRGNPIESRVIS